MITDKTDFTDAFKKAWTNHIKRLDEKKGYNAHHTEGKRFNELCNEIAGRPLQPNEMKNILHSVSTKKPKFKINKYGKFFTDGKNRKTGLDYETKLGAEHDTK